jgi:hypothetical protein
MDENTSWVDILTEGRIYRSLFYLLWTFTSGMVYLPFVAAGFGTAFGLSFILIGIPLLVMMFAGVRGLANLDRRIGGAFLDKDMPPMADDTVRGQSIFARLGSYLSSPITWLSIVYLLLRFVAGLFAMVALNVMIPLVLLEVLLLAPLGITNGTISMHVIEGVAKGIAAFSDSLLPNTPLQSLQPRESRQSTEKAKRRLETEPEYQIIEDEPYEDDEVERELRRRR